jgi:hypothetical protein
MEKFFSFFGKAVLVLALLGGISYGAYTLGRQTKPTDSGAAAIAVTPTVEPTIDPGLMPEKLPEENKKTTTITAGVGAESGLSFTKYELTVPQGWTPTHTTTNEGTWVDTLTLTKGTNTFKIFQAATGGAMCLYPNDADFEGPSSRYDTYVELKTADGVILRRGTTNTDNGITKGYTICQKGTETYGQPTGFGHMSVTTNIPSDPTVIAEVDAMIMSLKKR